MLDSICAQLKEERPALHRLKNNVILMDNHKWALYAWVQYFQNKRENEPLSLFHADYHWDGIDDFADGDETVIDRLMKADLVDLRQFIKEDSYIKYDSFIAPAVRLQVINNIYWYCLQEDEEEGIDPSVFDAGQLKQTFYKTVNDIPATDLAKKKVIFDLCLDLFNKSDMTGKGDLWGGAEITDFLDHISPIIKSAELVTVSLSYGCSGTDADTVKLVNLIMPIVEECRETTRILGDRGQRSGSE